MQWFRSSYWLALVAILVVIGWLASGDVTQARTALSEAGGDAPVPMPRVAYRPLMAEVIEETLRLEGVIEPRHSADIRARLMSDVVALPVREGQQVAAGELMIRLAEDDLPARIEAAQARIRQARAELEAAQSLMKRGLTAEAELKARESELADARAEFETLQSTLRHTVIRAPFAGTVETLVVDPGETVMAGDALATLVDQSQLRLVGHVPQQFIGRVREGQAVSGRLLDGTELRGVVTLVRRQADVDTRTFRLEASVPNPQGRRLAGATVSLSVSLGEVLAHALSPAYLTLDPVGRLSVQHVGEEDVLLETPVRRVRATHERIWVTGLPEVTRLVTMGKGFAPVGARVEAHAESTVEGEIAVP